MRSAPAWTGIVIGLLAGMLLGTIWLLSRQYAPAGAGVPVEVVDDGGAVTDTAGDGNGGGIDAADALLSSRRNTIVRATEQVAPAVVSINVIDHRTYTRAVVPRDMAFLERAFPGFFPRREFQQDVRNLGSGFIISEDGFIISNYHVVAGADEIVVTLQDGRQFDGAVQDSIPAFDLALLRIDGADLPVARLAQHDDMMIGEWAVAIGSPFGYLLADTQPSVTVGVISAQNRDIKRGEGGRTYLGMIQTDAAINPGNSGGPLINSEGEVVGVNTFIFSSSGGSVGIGFAVPVRRVRQFLEEVRDFGRYRQRYAGMSFQMLSPHLAARLGLRDVSGFIVTEVRQGSPADEAGLRPYDVISSFNGVPLHSNDIVVRLLYEVHVGTRLDFVAVRDGTEITGTLVLAEAP